MQAEPLLTSGIQISLDVSTIFFWGGRGGWEEHLGTVLYPSYEEILSVHYRGRGVRRNVFKFFPLF